MKLPSLLMLLPSDGSDCMSDEVDLFISKLWLYRGDAMRFHRIVELRLSVDVSSNPLEPSRPVSSGGGRGEPRPSVA